MDGALGDRRRHRHGRRPARRHQRRPGCASARRRSAAATAVGRCRPTRRTSACPARSPASCWRRELAADGLARRERARRAAGGAAAGCTSRSPTSPSSARRSSATTASARSTSASRATSTAAEFRVAAGAPTPTRSSGASPRVDDPPIDLRSTPSRRRCSTSRRRSPTAPPSTARTSSTPCCARGPGCCGCTTGSTRCQVLGDPGGDDGRRGTAAGDRHRPVPTRAAPLMPGPGPSADADEVDLGDLAADARRPCRGARRRRRARGSGPPRGRRTAPTRRARRPTWRSHTPVCTANAGSSVARNSSRPDPPSSSSDVQGPDRPADVEHHGAAVDVGDRLQRRRGRWPWSWPCVDVTARRPTAAARRSR